MWKSAMIVAVLASCTGAQVRTLSLGEVIDLASKQNPEVALARLDERKALAAVRIARSSFIPTVTAGSGLAYSNGFPQSIEGSSPSIIQAQATATVFSLEKSRAVSQARENARGATIDTQARRQDVIHRAALTFLDAERAARIAEVLGKQADSLARIADTVRARVAEGRELPVRTKEAELDLARTRQQSESLEAEQEYAERSLALLLGLEAGVRVRPKPEERTFASLPASEEELVQAAVEQSREMRGLESAVAAKGWEIRSVRAQRLPQIELVAQYSLLGRYNNYEDFFRKFQRHNGQVGIAFRIPLFAGTAVEARASQAEAEAAQLRIRLKSMRDRIALDTGRLYRQLRQAESARLVSKLDLDVARDQFSIALATMEEGRASLREVETARFHENQKWIAFIDSHYAEERARLDLFKQTGDLLAALR